MKEVITLQIGECGNTLADTFWDNLYSEHNLSYEKPLFNHISHDEYPDVYLKETLLKNCIPRTIIIDTDPHIKSYYINNILINSDTEGNWAKAYLELGPNLNSNLEDLLQKEAESADSLQGFQIFHSLGGGLGSGMTSYILTTLREIYSIQLISTFSVVPSEKMSQMPSEIYNSSFALNSLIEEADIVSLLDNQGLYRLCQNELGISQPYFTDLNSIINPIISAFTCTSRYKGNHTTSLRKIYSNFIPFPRYHFFIPSVYPLTSYQGIISENVLIDKITQNKYVVSDIQIEDAHNFGAFLITRGTNPMPNFKNPIKQAFDSRKIIPKIWVSECFNHENYLTTYRNIDNYGALFANNINLREIVKRVKEQFSSYFSKKVWIEKYFAFGYEEMQFAEVESNINDTCLEYTPYCFYCSEEVEENGELEVINDDCGHINKENFNEEAEEEQIENFYDHYAKDM